MVNTMFQGEIRVTKQRHKQTKKKGKISDEFCDLMLILINLYLQLQRLNEEMQKSKEERHHHECCGDQGVALSSSIESYNGKCEAEVRLNQGIVLCNDDIKTEYFGFEEETNHELMNIVEQADDSCLTSSDNWGGFNSDPLLDQSSSNYPWWDFWS